MTNYFLKLLISVLMISTLASGVMFGQEKKVNWKRDKNLVEEELHLFHSPQSINLPTSETMQQGDWEFEISHRFLPTINDGIKKLYGFDGPVNIRLALGYAVLNNLVLTLGRSNVDDNVDLWLKYRILQVHSNLFPLIIAARGGIGWNTDPGRKDLSDSRDAQYYIQFIFNTMIDKRLAIGVVPSYLYNSHIYSVKVQDSFTLGTNIQYYISQNLSVLAEWNPTVSGWRNQYNSMAFGFEIETGGHFFKIILSNNPLLNPSQYLAGSDLSINSKDWRIGFNITRLLQF